MICCIINLATRHILLVSRKLGSFLMKPMVWVRTHLSEIISCRYSYINVVTTTLFLRRPHGIRHDIIWILMFRTTNFPTLLVLRTSTLTTSMLIISRYWLLNRSFHSSCRCSPPCADAVPARLPDEESDVASILVPLAVAPARSTRTCPQHGGVEQAWGGCKIPVNTPLGMVPTKRRAH